MAKRKARQEAWYQGVFVPAWQRREETPSASSTGAFGPYLQRHLDPVTFRGDAQAGQQPAVPDGQQPGELPLGSAQGNALPEGDRRRNKPCAGNEHGENAECVAGGAGEEDEDENGELSDGLSSVSSHEGLAPRWTKKMWGRLGKVGRGEQPGERPVDLHGAQ